MFILVLTISVEYISDRGSMQVPADAFVDSLCYLQTFLLFIQKALATNNKKQHIIFLWCGFCVSVQITKASSLSIFKNKLKIFLFNVAFIYFFELFYGY